jgi:hypothetical protein
MKQSAHTVTLEPWEGACFGVRVALEASTALLWPFAPDCRMTILINLLADQIFEIAASDDQIDAIIDVLRLQLKLKLPDSPPLQSN